MQDKDNFTFDEDDFDYSEESVAENSEQTQGAPENNVAVAEAENTVTESIPEDAETVEENEAESPAASFEEVFDDYPVRYDNEPDPDEEERKARRKEKLHAVWSKAKLPLIISAAIIFCAALGLFIFALSTIKDDRVMNNVYIENLNVSGLTYNETLDAVNATYLFENSEITLTDGKNDFTINGSDIGLAALPEETAQRAFNYCKDGNIFRNAFNAARLLFDEHVIVPAPQLDDALLDEKLNECGSFMLGERKQHYAEFNEDNIATICSGQTGYDGDPSVAHEQVVTALNDEQLKNIHVDFKTAPPDDATVDSLDLIIYKDPVDARYEVNGNEVNIVPGETGRYIDKEEVAPLVNSIYEGCEPVAVPYYTSEPSVNEEVLREKLFANTLSSYSTNYGGSTENRRMNVARAASLINGSVVAPGEVFSFNDTVGHRTRENGFYTAKEYINGESVDGIGGGTCQVSSTLYSAVLYADLGIVERLNHMMSVGYIPLGQDATVSDGGVDFKFRNTSDYPVKVSAYTNGSTITVSIIGTAWDPARDVKLVNNSSASGANTVVYSTRYVYSNGELIATDTLNSSTYMPHKSAVTASAQSSSSSSSSSSYDDDEDDDSSDYSNDDEDE